MRSLSTPRPTGSWDKENIEKNSEHHFAGPFGTRLVSLPLGPYEMGYKINGKMVLGVARCDGVPGLNLGGIGDRSRISIAIFRTSLK